ncbi:MAG: sugar ABC transporter permease [Ruminococcaceae bacterium]|nr:sugar ABC transporter permease [Oscillospiraceae bacterium]
MKKRKPKGLETLKSRYGFIFLSPWIVGMIFFFLVPIIQSAYFSFAQISIGTGGVKTKFLGMENFDYILFKDTQYIDDFIAAITDMLISVPFILVVSLILAVMLNNKFRGRLFFRSLFFMPVIIASGAVLELYLGAASSNATEVAVNDSVSFGMIDFSEVFTALNLPTAIENYLSVALDNLFMLVWQSGIQIILFIAGLQSIPDLLYEVSKVEGATKWEEFWFITLPMLGRTMFLVIVFTIVENITKSNNEVISHGYNFFNNLDYGRGSASLWFYFLIIGLIMAVILLFYNKVFLKRWS